MTAQEKRDSMNILKRVLAEIDAEKDRYYIYPKTKFDHVIASRLRYLGYYVNMEAISRGGSDAVDYVNYGYVIRWEKDYGEDLGKDNW